MLRALPVVAFLCLASPLFADVSGEICGPSEVEPGELVELKTLVEGDSSIFEVSPEPDSLLERYDEAGQKCYVFVACSKACEYTAELMVIGIVDGKAVAKKTRHTVNVTGSPPDPEPEPEPNPPSPPGPAPDPEPEPDDGRFGVAKIAYRTAVEVDRPEEAKKLAEVYSDTAKTVREEEAGPLRVLTLIKKASADLGITRNGPWKPFNEAISGRLKSLYGEGMLSGPDDWAEAFEEIARGLAAVEASE